MKWLSEIICFSIHTESLSVSFNPVYEICKHSKQEMWIYVEVPIWVELADTFTSDSYPLFIIPICVYA